MTAPSNSGTRPGTSLRICCSATRGRCRCGATALTRDEWFLDLGALAFRDALTEAEVADERVHFELFEGGHIAVEYRMPPALARLAHRIAGPATSTAAAAAAAGAATAAT
ncbi:hypothetical protein [Streptomyces sp. NPDC059009]|uniref:hypothetical protein n=1 Tax=Streptomyces sp. NPDC059009 TaxID=3346694 RepID=UPI00368CA0EF